jgi:hypothetical protein
MAVERRNDGRAKSLMKRIAAVAVAALMLHPCAKSAGAEPSCPNILLILADTWRWPTAGVYGDPMARTPGSCHRP